MAEAIAPGSAPSPASDDELAAAGTDALFSRPIKMAADTMAEAPSNAMAAASADPAAATAAAEDEPVWNGYAPATADTEGISNERKAGKPCMQQTVFAGNAESSDGASGGSGARSTRDMEGANGAEDAGLAGAESDLELQGEEADSSGEGSNETEDDDGWCFEEEESNTDGNASSAARADARRRSRRGDVETFLQVRGTAL